MQRARRRCHFAAQGRLKGGQCRLVDAHRAGERVSADPLDEVGGAEHESGLRAAEELVAAGRHEVGPREEHRAGIRLVGQQRIGTQQPAADIDDEGDTRVATGLAQGLDVDGAREALDAEVARMDLEDEPGPLAERGRVVPQVRAIRRADLAQARPGRLEQLGDPEAVADLDHLAARNDDLGAARRHGQRARDEGERGGTVVDDEGVGAGGEPLPQGRERAATAAGTLPGDDVELDVAVAGGQGHRVAGRRGEPGPADVRVEDDAGGVEDAAQARRCVEARGELPQGGGADVGGVEGAASRGGLGRLDRGLDGLDAEGTGRLGELGGGEQGVGPGDRAARIGGPTCGFAQPCSLPSSVCSACSASLMRAS